MIASDPASTSLNASFALSLNSFIFCPASAMISAACIMFPATIPFPIPSSASPASPEFFFISFRSLFTSSILAPSSTLFNVAFIFDRSVSAPNASFPILLSATVRSSLFAVPFFMAFVSLVPRMSWKSSRDFPVASNSVCNCFVLSFRDFCSVSIRLICVV